MSDERLIPSSKFRAGAPPIDARPQRGVENYALVFALCLTALTLFRLVALVLSNTELFFDEAQYWFWSRELALGYYSKPPLIAWIIRATTEVCGQGEACVRAASPIIHAATATLVYVIGQRLYGARAGFWAGLTYATLPGVSLSSSLISTDVPLLFFVALALLALIKLRDGAGWEWTVILGGAIGLGLMSKYAMGYFVLSLLVYALWRREGRALLTDFRLYAAFAVAALIVAPNLLWNARNGFATFSHTADNANWRGFALHPDQALEFLGGQFGVFGPVLFAALLIYCVNWLRDPDRRAGAPEADRLLLAFSLPVLLLIVGQALLSRAHANWAAFAYVPATVLIAAVLLREGWDKLLRFSGAFHLAGVLVIAAGAVLAGRIEFPWGADPYARVLGWRPLANAAGDRAEAGGFRAIATDRRALAAELLYYLRDRNIPVFALRDDGPPRDHFELTRPLTDETPRPVLIVTLNAQGPRGSRPLGGETVAAGPSESRRVFFFSLE